jgi:hypothetical protein
MGSALNSTRREKLSALRVKKNMNLKPTLYKKYPEGDHE